MAVEISPIETADTARSKHSCASCVRTFFGAAAAGAGAGALGRDVIGVAQRGEDPVEQGARGGGDQAALDRDRADDAGAQQPVCRRAPVQARGQPDEPVVAQPRDRFEVD
ncbi:MAG TPA: hypothetical protein PLL32_09800, partial [Anaeromyxobacteraceae bacterium]|nr:hypothetical protein [Anaeromyxobacteraceae bacterium]